jgi:hypothetical protein
MVLNIFLSIICILFYLPLLLVLWVKYDSEMAATKIKADQTRSIVILKYLSAALFLIFLGVVMITNIWTDFII